MAKKIGEDFAKEWFRRGLDELREIGHFSGGNVAQPNRYHAFGDREQVAPPPAPTPGQAPPVERER
ncbi:hypothetical protein [Frigoriglobus tundricola]|uniref:Uncharacterized protein n=1 Tax=Frigoriglobus tundricola TaxID=2774151 RepID=A0A6M5Z3V8_9BACT|nr:hypothetical protein [Frigoriglobus tundricola]QJX01078.1 hypothetical protein FTUN_8717 [Frigoriglobus tundricola]